MLTPRQIESLADAVLDAYAEFDITMRSVAARHLRDLEAIDRQQVIRAIQRSGDVRQLERAIASTYIAAGRADLIHDEKVYKAARAAGLISGTVTEADREATRNILAHAVTQAQKTHNLVGTVARNAVSAQFTAALDKAMLDVATGAVSHGAAIAGAVDTMARGQTLVTYMTAEGAVRTDTLYTVARRNVMTGVNQATNRLTNYRLDKYGVEWVEISAHAGARPEHAEWQGEIMPRKDLEWRTDYGSAAGLLGVNCRHDYGPFFPGVTEPADHSDLEALDNEAEYELSQRQRLCERNVRTYRAREDIYLAGGQADKAGESRRLRDKWYAEGKDVAARRRDFPRLGRMVPFPGEERW